MERLRRVGNSQRQLEEEGYRVIRLERAGDGDSGMRQAENDPELYAPIVVHNLRRVDRAEEVNRFEKALELRKLGRSVREIRELLGFG